MIPRYRIILPLVAMCLALMIAPAFAVTKAKTQPVESIPAGTYEVGTISSTAAAVCPQIGQPDANFQYPWLYPPDDKYSVFIDPATCFPSGVLITSAHWILNWTSPCEIDNVVVTVEAAVETTPGCFVPDESQVLCGPVLTNLSAASPALIDHSVPLTCTTLNQKAFICFKLPTGGNCPLNGDGSLASPLYIFDNTPETCVSYNTFPGSGGPLDMVTTFGFPGNTSMYVVGDAVTPVSHSTWGKVRTLYR